MLSRSTRSLQAISFLTMLKIKKLTRLLTATGVIITLIILSAVAWLIYCDALSMIENGKTVWTILIGMAVGFILFFAGFLVLSKAIVRRIHAERKLAGIYDHLNDLVHIRTSELENANALLKREIEGRQQIEQALRVSKEQYRCLFNGITEGFALHEIICDENGTPCDYRFLEMTPSFEQLTGLKRGDVIGKTKTEVMPHDNINWIKIYGEVALTGRPIRFDGFSQTFNKHYEIYAYRPAPNQCAVVFMDITERKTKEVELNKLNRALRALSRSRQAMLQAKDESSYLNQICEIIAEDCGHLLVWIGFAEQNEAKTVRTIAQAGFDEGYIETLNVTWDETERGLGPTGTAIRSGKPCLCRDMAADPVFEPWRHEALKRGYASSVAIPLLSNGKVFGIINIHSKVVDAFSAKEIELLSELAEDITYGIKTIRIKIAHDLAEASLRESEERLRLAQLSASVGVWDWDLRTGKVVFTPELERLYGAAPGSIRHVRDFIAYVHPEDIAKLEARNENLLRGQSFDLEFRILRPDGEVRWISGKGGVMLNDGKAVRAFGVSVDITDRKKAEEALQRSEQHFRTLFETMLQGVVYQDIQGNVISMNPAAEWILGKTFSEFASKTAFDGAHPALTETGDIFPVAEHPAMLALQTGREQQNVIMNVYNPRRQSYRWLKVTSVPVFRPGELIPCEVHTLIEDISERKSLEEALQESKRNYDGLFNNQSAGLTYCKVVLNENKEPVDFEFLSVNDTYLAFTGLWKENIIGKRVSEVLPGFPKSEIDRQARVAMTGEEQHYELYEPNRQRSYDINIYSPQQGYFVSILYDITDRKLAETALRQREAQLWEASQFLEHAPVFVRAVDGTIILWNSGMETLYGFPKDEALGKISHQLLQTHFPKSSAEILAELYRDGRWKGELQNITRSGSPIIVNSMWFLHTDAEGKPVAIIEVNSDITDRKLMEERLAEQTVKLERSNQELEDFACVASHDLQEPLHVITLYLELLVRNYGDKLGPDAKQFMERAKSGAADAQTLIRSLLEYARVGSTAKNQTVDMEFIFQQVMAKLEVAIQESGAEITHEALPVLSADPIQTAQLFQNLLANAIKYRHPDRPLKIRVRTEQKENEYVFSVQDNGIGIAPKDHGRVFKLFQRLHGPSQYSGAGIGLAVCKKIIECNGGRIWLESRPQEGTTFFFTFPSSDTLPGETAFSTETAVTGP